MESLGFSIHMTKTTMRYHLTHGSGWLLLKKKKPKTASVNKDVVKLEPLYTFDGNAK